ncbi:hypothetical protein AVEN_113033-1, partial [Araneus ventricosus]
RSNHLLQCAFSNSAWLSSSEPFPRVTFTLRNETESELKVKTAAPSALKVVPTRFSLLTLVRVRRFLWLVIIAVMKPIPRRIENNRP